MGTFICQVCSQTLGHFEGEKVSRLYAVSNCTHCQAKSAKPSSSQK
ncbi:GapA-binding peptide SR1P [Shouchella sp. 1P09AA]|nr:MULTISPECIES: GapA-binding peptide SR1P [Bacillaceae]UTR04900.1 GapA-binding peptide SR1P [Alkalihalobacillus sp. LMS6]